MSWANVAKGGKQNSKSGAPAQVPPPKAQIVPKRQHNAVDDVSKSLVSASLTSSAENSAVQGASGTKPEQTSSTTRDPALADGDEACDDGDAKSDTSDETFSSIQLPRHSTAFAKRGTLLTNHFSLKLGQEADPPKQFYQYPMIIDLMLELPKESSDDAQKHNEALVADGEAQQAPEKESEKKRIGARLRRRIIRSLLIKLTDDNKKGRPGFAAISDFRDKILSSMRIKPEPVVINFLDEDETDPRSRCAKYRITFGKEQLILVSAVCDYLSGNGLGAFTSEKDAFSATEEVVDALNMVVSTNAYQGCSRTPNKIPTYAFKDGRKFCIIPGKLQFSNGVSFVDKKWAWDLDYGLIALPGFFRSIRALRNPEHPMLLNVNTTTGHFYHAAETDRTSLADIINRFRSRRPTPSWQAVEEFIAGLRVQTRYMKRSPAAKNWAQENNETQLRERVFSVAGLPYTNDRGKETCWNNGPAPTSSNVTFTVNEGRTNVKDYFKKVHDINLTGNELVVRIGKQNFQPADGLHVLPGQPFKGKALPITQGCRDPADNLQMIKHQGMPGMYTIPYNIVQRFGISVNPTPLTVNYVKLDQVRIGYRREKELVKSPSWNLRNRTFINASKKPKHWSFLEICGDDGPSDSDQVLASVQAFQKIVKNTGINLTFDGDLTKGVVPRNQVSSAQLSQKLKQWINQRPSKSKKPLDFLLVLLPGSNSDKSSNASIYAGLKRWAELEAGLPTICMLKQSARNDKRKLEWSTNPSYLGNLMVKLNIKLDHDTANHVLNAKFKSPLLTAETMLVGMDVTHPGVGAMPEAPSVAAMVANIDEHYNQFPAGLRMNHRATVEKQPKQSTEEIFCLEEMLNDRLDAWKRHNKSLPKRIIFFRDGVSVEQFKMCKTRELRQLKASITKKYAISKVAEPEIMVICTVKRHHCRFYQADGTNADDLRRVRPGPDPSPGNGNPVSGVAIFEGVTHGDYQDFFLVSQDAAKGTARPTHYVVLHNEFKTQIFDSKTGKRDITIRDIADMVYQLCWVYVPATKVVGLVPPSYYADRAADRARVYLDAIYNPTSTVRKQIYDKLNVNHNPAINPVEKLRDRMYYI